jgi:hypothetical protein
VIPRAQTVRFVGAKRPRTAPLGGSWVDDGDAAGAAAAEALAVQLPDDVPSPSHVPEPETLAPGTWVVLLPDPQRGRGLLSAFGRKPIARAARSRVLLLRGYVDIGAGVDPASRLDVVYGRVP